MLGGSRASGPDCTRGASEASVRCATLTHACKHVNIPSKALHHFVSAYLAHPQQEGDSGGAAVYPFREARAFVWNQPAEPPQTGQWQAGG